MLDEHRSRLMCGIVDDISSQCVTHLKLVSDIPRLYRRTNRDVPTKPSSYVTAAVNPISLFLDQNHSYLTPEEKLTWIRNIVTAVAQQ